MIQDKIFPGYQPICKNICVDFGFKIDQNNPYLGLQWLISHNMIIDGKTSVNLNSNDDTDIVTHNIIGAKTRYLKLFDYQLDTLTNLNKLWDHRPHKF